MDRRVILALLLARPALASDHLDTPTVIADPAADIGDVYAWADHGRLDLAMTIVGHRFSDRVRYVFHVASGAAYGATTASIDVQCRFDVAGTAECWLGDRDYARGDASHGLDGQRHRFRVFAGPRDDPFFNNVKGTRQALSFAAEAFAQAPRDAAGCPVIDPASARGVLDRWAHTDGGPAVDTLAGWTPASLVVSVELAAVTTGGPVLAVWAGTYR